MPRSSRFVAPRMLGTWDEVRRAFQSVQEALDRASRSAYVIGLATGAPARSLALTCPGFFRVSAPVAGSSATLPRASENNAGDMIVLCLESMLGSLVVHAPPGQTINGASTATFNVDGIQALFSNGVDGWRSQAQTPVGGAGTSTWAQVLAAGNVSGGTDPTVSAGDTLQFAAGGQINAVDSLTVTSATDTHIHPSGQLHLGHTGSTDSVHIEADGAVEVAAGANIALQAVGALAAESGAAASLTGATDVTASASAGSFFIYTNSVLRLEITNNGDWVLGAAGGGFVNQVLTSSGAGLPPTWEDADSLVTPYTAGDGIDLAAFQFSVDVTDIVDGVSIEEVATNNIRRAALTGDVIAAAGSNTTTIANDAVTNPQLANMAQSTIKGRAEGAGTGDPTDLSVAQVKAILDSTWAESLANGNTSGANDVEISSSQHLRFGALSGGLPSTGDIRKPGDLLLTTLSSIMLRDNSTLNAVSVDANGCIISGDNSGGFVDIQSNTSVGTRVSGTGGTGAGSLRIVEGSSSSPTVSAGEGMHWVRSNAPCEPWFTDDTNVDRPMQNAVAEQQTVSTVSAATTVLATTQTYTIPANTLRVGSRFTCEFEIEYVRGGTATALNLGFFFDIGGTNISVGTPARTSSGTFAAKCWATFTVLSTGSGGTAVATIFAAGYALNNIDSARFAEAHNTSLSINTTIANNLRGAAQMNTAVANTSISTLGGHITQQA